MPGICEDLLQVSFSLHGAKFSLRKLSWSLTAGTVYEMVVDNEL